MDYLSTVLTDPLFANYAIAGLIIFGIFGLWRFYVLYLFIVVITFTDSDKMKWGIIFLVAVLSFHYLSTLLTLERKSPFRDVTQ
jgi:hypothetical protein